MSKISAVFFKEINYDQSDQLSSPELKSEIVDLMMAVTYPD